MGSSQPPTAGTPRNSLPVQLTSFIGRDREICAVKDLLARARLVTLAGPGGSGKTRLAMRAATDLIDEFGDGVHFVALASIRDPDLVVTTIGRTLAVGMDGARPPLETLTEHLRDRELLLVLDNLEQVLDVGPCLVELLAACERLKLLATSRIPLRVSGEQELDVPLRSAIAWSYDLLDTDEQALFRRLAIFVGGCTLETVEAMGAADLGSGPALSPEEGLDGVGALLAKNLVRRTDGTDGVPRFAMLETIREYGLESLALAGELPALRVWHARYYLELVEAAGPRLRGPDQVAWL